MIESLRSLGSRAGKTALIKGLFIAEAEGSVEIPFEFFLYKHGPYSTDIEDNIDQMKSYGALKLEPAFDGYGVHLSPAEMASFVYQQRPLPAEVRAALQQVCRF